MSIRDMNFFFCRCEYSRCTFRSAHIEMCVCAIKIFLQLARECSDCFSLTCLMEGKKSAKHIYIVFFSLPFILFVFQTYFSISVDFSLPYACVCGSGNRSSRQKKLHNKGFRWLTYSHILKFIAVRFIFLFILFFTSVFQREKNPHG